MSNRTPAPVALVLLLAWPLRATWRRKRRRTILAKDLRRAGVHPMPVTATGEEQAPSVSRIPVRSWSGPVAAAAAIGTAWARTWPGPSPLLLAAIATVGSLWVWRIRSTSARTATGVLVLGALVWSAWPVAQTSGWHWAILVLALGVTVERRARHFRAAPADEEHPEDDDPIHKWAVTLGARGPFEGSRMDGPASPVIRDGDDLGYTMAWRGVPGRHTVGSLLAQRENIASLYGVEPDRIVIERTGDASRGIVSVYRKSPFGAPRLWTPGLLDPAKGTAEISTFPDGSRGRLQFWAPGQGVKMGMIVGATGSGKTDATNAALGAMLSCGRVVLDLVDLGVSGLPAWRDVSFRFGTSVEDAFAALERANAIIDARQDAMTQMTWTGADGVVRQGVTCLDPCPEWPGYAVVIDEWPEVLRAERKISTQIQQLAERVATKGRKHGVFIVIISQTISLDAAFQSCKALRTQIQNGWTIGLRSDAQAGRMAFGSGLDVDLSAIPTGRPGLGYVLSTVTQRDVLSRVDWPASDCPTCRGGEDRDECPACGGTGLRSDPWMVVKNVRPGRLNPVDVAALSSLEDLERWGELPTPEGVELEKVPVPRETKRTGRPTTITPEQIEDAQVLRDQGVSVSEAATLLRVDRKTLSRALERAVASSDPVGEVLP